LSSIGIDRIRVEFRVAQHHLRDFVEKCAPAGLDREVPGDGRSVRQVAAHCIDGWQMVIDGFNAVQTGQPMPAFDGPAVDARNAADALRTAQFTREHTLAAMEAVAAQVENILGFLTDDVLEAPGPATLRGEQSVGEVLRQTLVFHVDEHLAALIALEDDAFATA